MYIEWDNSYSVGIQSFDGQHKKIFGMINALHAAMVEKKTREAMGKTLEELVEYTRTHFADEEVLMEKHKFPEYGQHKRAHDELIVQVNDLYHRFRLGEPVISVELFGFLMNWLKNHIQGVDKKYTAFLNAKGVR
jgi:hemerythrin-like metal-binding protein